MVCLSVSFFLPPRPVYRSLMIMVDMHSRLESAEDMVAQIMAAEIRPVTTPGA